MYKSSISYEKINIVYNQSEADFLFLSQTNHGNYPHYLVTCMTSQHVHFLKLILSFFFFYFLFSKNILSPDSWYMKSIKQCTTSQHVHFLKLILSFFYILKNYLVPRFSIYRTILIKQSTTHHCLDWGLGLGLWYLTPLSTIFQLYRSGQFYS